MRAIRRPVDRRLRQVHRGGANEAGHKERRGAVVERLRRVNLLEHALAEHRDAVSHRHRFSLVVRDIDRRYTEAPLEARDLRAQLDTELRIEVRERLVHQEDLRLAHDRSPDSDPLTLPAGELGRLLGEKAGEVKHLRRLAHARVYLLSLDATELEAEAHVVAHGQMRVERVILENHRYLAVARRDVVHDTVGDRHGATGDRFEPSDHPQHRRLSAP